MRVILVRFECAFCFMTYPRRGLFGSYTASGLSSTHSLTHVLRDVENIVIESSSRKSIKVSEISLPFPSPNPHPSTHPPNQPSQSTDTYSSLSLHAQERAINQPRSRHPRLPSTNPSLPLAPPTLLLPLSLLLRPRPYFNLIYFFFVSFSSFAAGSIRTWASKGRNRSARACVHTYIHTYIHTYMPPTTWWWKGKGKIGRGRGGGLARMACALRSCSAQIYVP